jgi:hypothetical protein
MEQQRDDETEDVGLDLVRRFHRRLAVAVGVLAVGLVLDAAGLRWGGYVAGAGLVLLLIVVTFGPWVTTLRKIRASARDEASR